MKPSTGMSVIPTKPVAELSEREGGHGGLAEERRQRKAERKAAKAAAKAAADGAAGGKKDKKAKKRKHAAAESAANGAADGTAIGKKERKAKKQKQVASESAANGEAAPPAKKPKVAPAAAAAAQQGKQPAGKKSKPAKKPCAQAAQPGGLAAVGDRSLASSRPPLTKRLYTEPEAVRSTPQAEVDAYRQERRITVEAGPDVRPVTAFAQTGLSEAQLHATREFAGPSPIQAQCLPIMLAGQDLIGIAATGSGKTLAFGLPALAHVRAQIDGGAASGRKPVALVLAPTRELALQIHTVLADAGSRCGIASVCVYGGVPKKEQTAALRAGALIVIATPGRLQDLADSGSCRLDEVSFLVLDEADRMLDLGFEPAIRKIAGATRADRQTALFSATWPKEVAGLAAEFVAPGAARVRVGSAQLAASHSVTQVVEVVDGAARDARLQALLQQYHGSKGRSNRIIVFVLYKKEAARVEGVLARKGWKAAAVHGDASQAARTAAVDAFRSGEVPILVATDVAARGLDIPDVEVVINYSFPLTTEDYVHRIGRTGRAGKSGTAHTLFVGATDKARAGELVNVLREARQPVPPELLAFGTTVKKKESKLYGAHFREVDESQRSTKVTFDSDDDSDA